MSNHYKTATLNFGGINASKLEYVDFSTTQSKTFFEKIQSEFDCFSGEKGDITIKKFIQEKLSEYDVAYINFLLECATKFMVENMNSEFLLELYPEERILENSATIGFDVGSVSLNTFFTNVLKRDKGIGGFEQICQSRQTNLGNIDQFIEKSQSDGEYEFNKEKYINSIKLFYIDGKGVPYNNLSKIKSFRDIFMKGRKEGEGGSQKNYYKYYEEGSSKNGDVLNDERLTLFHGLANLVMMLYDLISYDIITNSGLSVPKNIVEKPSIDEVTKIKTDFVVKFLFKQKVDVIFITECIPGIFEDHIPSFFEKGYIVEYGEELNGLCNSIIYRGFGIVFQQWPINVDTYKNKHEFKEPILHLYDSDTDINLVCYHANGKGVNVKDKLSNTSFYKWFNSLSGTVILGGDLNMDFKKNGQELSEIFDVGAPSSKGFSCYKQRSPLQAQYDKAGVYDKKYCDYIITNGLGFKRIGATVVKSDINGNTTRVDNPNEKFSDNELVIPNSEFPFEHYIVIDSIKKARQGFTFFSRISSCLSWIDAFLNRVFGYN